MACRDASQPDMKLDQEDGLIEGAATMADAAAAGQLDTRVDDSTFQGVWQTIAKGLNDTAEGVVVPLRDIGGVLDRLANDVNVDVDHGRPTRMRFSNSLTFSCNSRNLNSMVSKARFSKMEGTSLPP